MIMPDLSFGLGQGPVPSSVAKLQMLITISTLGLFMLHVVINFHFTFLLIINLKSLWPKVISPCTLSLCDSKVFQDGRTNHNLTCHNTFNNEIHLCDTSSPCHQKKDNHTVDIYIWYVQVFHASQGQLLFQIFCCNNHIVLIFDHQLTLFSSHYDGSILFLNSDTHAWVFPLCRGL